MVGPSFDIESHRLTATLYVHRPLGVADLRDVRIACALLPPEVRQLRIDARALADADSRTWGILHDVLRHWRRMRGGQSLSWRAKVSSSSVRRCAVDE